MRFRNWSYENVGGQLQKLIDCMEPPPVATALAFHPRHNSIFVIGMDDATIQIYDGRLGQVKFLPVLKICM